MTDTYNREGTPESGRGWKPEESGEHGRKSPDGLQQASQRKAGRKDAAVRACKKVSTSPKCLRGSTNGWERRVPGIRTRSRRQRRLTRTQGMCPQQPGRGTGRAEAGPVTEGPDRTTQQKPPAFRWLPTSRGREERSKELRVHREPGYRPANAQPPRRRRRRPCLGGVWHRDEAHCPAQASFGASEGPEGLSAGPHKAPVERPTRGAPQPFSPPTQGRCTAREHLHISAEAGSGEGPCQEHGLWRGSM